MITIASCLVNAVRAARNHTISEYLRSFHCCGEVVSCRVGFLGGALDDDGGSLMTKPQHDGHGLIPTVVPYVGWLLALVLLIWIARQFFGSFFQELG